MRQKSWRKLRQKEKRDLYRQGLMDAKAGRGLRWRQHPFLEEYKRGHNHGVAWFPPSSGTGTRALQAKLRTLLSTLERWIGRRPGK